MKLLILAGGLGTRLKTVVSDLPKAMAPVCGRPFLALQLEHWIAQGLDSFVFLLYHKSDHIIEYIDSIKHELLAKCEVEYVIEKYPLDTGGAVANAVAELQLSGDFLLTNADTWVGAGIIELSKGPTPSIAAVEVDDASRYGQLELDESSNITAFNEKAQIAKSGWINAGMCKLSVNEFIAWDGKAFSLEKDTFPRLIGEGGVRAIRLHSDFIDIGIPTDYLRFCNWVESSYQGKL
ncbi:MAG: NDP-sugar pyrophosphorylase family protein [Candidatus Azotimanducaceae bacterium]|jgi:NDP-sugar pyrophosphorylase family protein